MLAAWTNIQIAGVLMAHVLSVAVTIGGSRDSLTRLVTRVLNDKHEQNKDAIPEHTHRDPMPNIINSPIFCIIGTCSLMIIGTGRMRRMTSVPALRPAVDR